MIDVRNDLVRWLATFEVALSSGRPAAVTSLFLDASYWRDLVAFSWNIVTVEGHAGIAGLLGATLARTKPRSFVLDGHATQADGIAEAAFTFETELARCNGYVRLKDGKCWTLLTAMIELKGFEEPRGRRRDKGVEHEAPQSDRNWLERKTDEERELGYSRQPYCVILGGGQGGIGLGARLKRLGVPTIIVERNARAGDSWRNRYKSLHLHDPVWFDHLPYLPFPDHWPVFSPKDKIGDWLEMYTKVMELDYWSSTECMGARYDSDKREWGITVRRNSETVVLRPAHFVFATGVSGMPVIPTFPGAGAFVGEQFHSTRYRSGEAYRNKNCVVIGSNNSAHDICADLVHYGADVTMVQRSSTLVTRSQTLVDELIGPLYSEGATEAGITTERADLISASWPYRLMPELHIPLYRDIARRNAKFYDALKDVGFMLDFGEDGSGLFVKYLRRGSGYYIDVGASAMVASGRIKLKSRVTVREIRSKSVVLSDGSEVPANVIIYATGFGSMDNWVAQVISPDVARKVSTCWGLGSGTAKDPGPWEGELRNMWKPTRQEALWFHGGNLQQARYYSQFLALQLKARMEGLPTEVCEPHPVAAMV